MIGIMAIDPGNSTGVAWGIFDETAPTIAEAMRARIRNGSQTFVGDPLKQVVELAQLWMDFRHDCVVVGSLDPEQTELVIEDWQINPNQRWGAITPSPVQIAYGLIGYRIGRAVEYENGGWGPAASVTHVWQPPSAASRATRPQLERWNCWIRGREHERTAWAHIAVRIAHLMKRR